MAIEKRTIAVAVVIAVFAATLGVYLFADLAGSGKRTSDVANALPTDATAGAAAGSPDTVAVSDTQLAAVKVEPAGEREFPIEKSAVGSIDFNEDMTVQVFTPYQGRIVGLFAKVGDDVTKGQTLFTIDSPDLLQAESTLISAAGVLDFTTRNLARLRELYKTRAVSQKDMEQAASDQQTAEGA